MVHSAFAYRIATPRIEVELFAGPSYFTTEVELIDLATSESQYPFDDISLMGGGPVALKDSGIGFNVGAGMAYYFDTKQKEGGTPSIAQLQRIRKISDYEGTAGQLGRAVLAHDLAFLLTIDRQCVIDILGPRISAANAEGAALRAVMLRYGSVTQAVMSALAYRPQH